MQVIAVSANLRGIINCIRSLHTHLVELPVSEPVQSAYSGRTEVLTCAPLTQSVSWKRRGHCGWCLITVMRLVDLATVAVRHVLLAAQLQLPLKHKWPVIRWQAVFPCRSIQWARMCAAATIFIAHGRVIAQSGGIGLERETTTPGVTLFLFYL